MAAKTAEPKSAVADTEAQKLVAARSRDLEAAISSITKSFGDGAIMRLGAAGALLLHAVIAQRSMVGVCARAARWRPGGHGRTAEVRTLQAPASTSASSPCVAAAVARDSIAIHWTTSTASAGVVPPSPPARMPSGLVVAGISLMIVS